MTMQPLLLVLGALMMAACSDVQTSNLAQEARATAASSEHLQDGRIRDTFRFDEFETQAAVDVLIIDDNSDSMRDKQEKLAARLASFLGSLGKIDWQIGITTTDTSNGTYGLQGSLVEFAGTGSKILTKKTENYAQAFADTVIRRETISCNYDCPSNDERPLRATIQAIQKRDSENAGFFRDGADLAVIILSDEDEASVGGPDANRPTDVLEAFRTAFGDSKSLNGFGILIAPDDKKCYESESMFGANYAKVLSQFVMLTGGVVGSLCANDYGPTLAGIGQRVREGVKTAILTALPVAESVQVHVTPADPTLTWTMDGRRLTFAHPPKPGATVIVEYQVE